MSHKDKTKISFSEELIKERFDYWEDSRGAYILSQKYRDELREFLFTGDAPTMCNFEEYKKELEEERKEDLANG